VTWETHEPCFFIDVRGGNHGHVFASYVIAHGGRHWMFYTGVTTDNTQRIGVAVSDDLFHWRRAGDRPVIRPEEYDWAFCPPSGGAACRDAHVITQDGRFQLYYTAVKKDGNGCVARASSTDLLNWRDEGIVYGFNAWNQCKSSNVQRTDDGYWLLFFGGHHAWSYGGHPPPRRPLARGAYFGLRYYRLMLGVLDWSAAEPTITQVTDKSIVAEFGRR
jgi:hypothetical protein